MRHMLRSRTGKVFQVQMYKNNARALLSCILCILNSDWLWHACSVHGVYECYLRIKDYQHNPIFWEPIAMIESWKNSIKLWTCSFLTKFFLRFFTVAGNDIMAPTIQNCPNNIALSVQQGVTQTQAFWSPEPTATDDSGVPPTMTQTHRPGDFFPIGSTPVIYVFTDAAGNRATCSFNVVGE